MSFNEKEAAVEAILFAAGEPVNIKVIALAIEEDTDTAKKIIQDMAEAYNNDNRGIHIIELEDSYQLGTRNEYYGYLIKAQMNASKPRLTEVMLETLSIIAYKQPVTRLEVEKIRGVRSDHAINKLLDYELVKEIGRLDAPGRPVLFGTTDGFLRAFGIKSPDELPVPDPDCIDS